MHGSTVNSIAKKWDKGTRPSDMRLGRGRSVSLIDVGVALVHAKKYTFKEAMKLVRDRERYQ